MVDASRKLKRELLVIVRTAQQRIRYGQLASRSLPIIFGNAMPKSGSHILMQFLEGLVEVAPFVMRAKLPVRTLTIEGRRRSEEEILHDLYRLRKGEIGWGYIHATVENMAALASPGQVSYFVYRDPRDMIISHIFYALEIHAGHRMRAFYQDELSSMEARIEATIRGVDDPQYAFPNIRADYDRYIPWLDQPRTLPVRFEDLVNNRDATLLRMIQHVESSGYQMQVPQTEILKTLHRFLDPARSPTYRKGKSGGWREHFTPKNVRTFKEVTGDLLVRLGYEPSMDW